MNEMTVRESAPALMTASDILTQTKLVQEVMKAVMKDGTHYGVIPGTPKPSLWKPGAEVLCATFRIAVSYRVEDLSTDDYIRYRVTAVGTHQSTGIALGEGMGEASSNEQKYKWVKAGKREWAETAENRRRKKYGYDKAKREEYEVLQVRTEPADVANTILKMACKRGHVAMTLNVTAASDVFSQDLEELDERLRDSIAGEESGADGKPGYKEPQSKSGNGHVDKETGEVSPFASEGEVKHTTKKIEAAGKTFGAALVALKIAPDTKLTSKQCKEMILWASRPEGDPSKSTPQDALPPQQTKAQVDNPQP